MMIPFRIVTGTGVTLHFCKLICYAKKRTLIYTAEEYLSTSVATHEF